MSAVSYTKLDLAVKKADAASKNELTSQDAEEFIWSVIEIIATAGGSGASAVLQLLHFLRNAQNCAVSDDDANDGLVPNPYFVVNGHGGASPKTRTYLRNRGFKSLGSAAVGIAGGAGSSITQVDVLSGVKHASAVVTTGVHMGKLSVIKSRHSGSTTVAEWVNAMEKAKAIKLGVRSSSLAGAVIPVGGLGLATSAVAAIAALGIKLTLGKLIARTAMEVHWRSFQETKIASAFGGVSGPQGPGSSMFYEVFTRRGVTRVFGKYDTGQLILEPGGWLALNDKLLLL